MYAGVFLGEVLRLPYLNQGADLPPSRAHENTRKNGWAKILVFHFSHSPPPRAPHKSEKLGGNLHTHTSALKVYKMYLL